MPELTRGAGIQLNGRVSLRRKAKAVSVPAPAIAPSGPSMAKPSGDYTPLGGFVSRGAQIANGHNQTVNGTGPRSQPGGGMDLWIVISLRRSITGRLVYGQI